MSKWVRHFIDVEDVDGSAGTETQTLKPHDFTLRWGAQWEQSGASGAAAGFTKLQDPDVLSANFRAYGETQPVYAYLPGGLYGKGTTTAWKGPSWDVLDGAADVELLAAIAWTAGPTATDRAPLFLRGTGTAGSESGYFCTISGTNTLTIYKVVAGTKTVLGTTTTNIPQPFSGYIVHLRFGASGTTLRAKAWLKTGTEPASWQLSVTDSAITAGGWNGFAIAEVSAFHAATLYAIAAGTAGDTAPALPLGDEHLNALLTMDGAARTFLVELTCKAQASDDATQFDEYRVCLATTPFISHPDDTPSSWSYDDLVERMPTFSRRMGDALHGKSSLNIGDLIVRNETLEDGAGALDSWLNANWAGMPFRIYIGHPTWRRCDFRLILAGVIETIYAASDSTIGFRLRDENAALEKKEILQNTFDNTYPTAIAGQWRPICLGTVFNITPFLTNAATLEYELHDGNLGTINSITQVRDSGVSVAFTAASGNRRFTLNAAPTNTGKITADVSLGDTSRVGTNYGSSTPTGMLIYLASVCGGVDAARILVPLSGTYPGGALGLYVDKQKPVTWALDRLSQTYGAFYAFTRQRYLRFKRIAAPAAPAAHEFIADDLLEDGLTPKTSIPPVLSRPYYYGHNFTPQDALAGSVSAADKAAYQTEWIQSTNVPGPFSSSDPSAPDKHDLARRLAPVESLFSRASSTSADVIIDDLEALTDSPATIYQARLADLRGLALELGDTVKLTHPRYGFSAGRYGIVVGLEDDYDAQQVTLELLTLETTTQPGTGRNTAAPARNDRFMDYPTT